MNNVTFINNNRNADLLSIDNSVGYAGSKKKRNFKSGVAKSVSFSNTQYLNLDNITTSVFNGQA